MFSEYNFPNHGDGYNLSSSVDIGSYWRSPGKQLVSNLSLDIFMMVFLIVIDIYSSPSVYPSSFAWHERALRVVCPIMSAVVLWFVDVVIAHEYTRSWWTNAFNCRVSASRHSYWVRYDVSSNKAWKCVSRFNRL